MAFVPDYRGTPDWMLGLAKIRAQQILKLVALYDNFEAGPLEVLRAIAGEARAILDDKEPE